MYLVQTRGSNGGWLTVMENGKPLRFVALASAQDAADSFLDEHEGVSMADVRIHEITGECVYCARVVEHVSPPPAVDDDATWNALAEQHAVWCDWILSRAGRR